MHVSGETLYLYALCLGPEQWTRLIVVWSAREEELPGRFCSWRLSALLPLIALPLNLSPTTMSGMSLTAKFCEAFVQLLWGLGWEIILKPQPPHTRQKYEQKYGPETAEFALFSSILGLFLSRFLFIFLPCMWGGGGHSRISD